MILTFCNKYSKNINGKFKTYSQFLQHLPQYYFAKKLQSSTVIREKLSKALLYKKAAHKMLVTLKPVVNFINILQTAFLPIFFCPKKLQSHTVSKEKLRKALLYKKAACKMLAN